MESRTRIAVAVFVVATLGVAGAIAYSIRSAAVEEKSRKDGIARRLDEATLELERCVTGGDDPTDYGGALLSRVREHGVDEALESDWELCQGQYSARQDVIRSLAGGRLPIGPQFTHWTRRSTFDEVCNDLAEARRWRESIHAEIGLPPSSLKQINCNAVDVVATSVGGHAKSDDWEVFQSRHDELVVTDDRMSPRYGRIALDGTATWSEPPNGWTAVNRSRLYGDAATAFVLGAGEAKERVGVWTGPEDFQSRELPWVASGAVVGPEQWFFLKLGRDSVELAASPDQARTVKRGQVSLPLSQAAQDSFVTLNHWAVADGSGVLIIVNRVAGDPENGELFAIRVDRDLVATVSSLEYGLDWKAHRLRACTTSSGLFATLGDRLVVHVGAAPTLVRDFGVARVPAITCVGDEAIVLVATDEQITRQVCDAQECRDESTLVRGKAAGSLTATPEGARMLVYKSPILGAIHIVDEPIGGPLERIQRVVLAPKSTHADLYQQDLPMVIDGVLFAEPRFEMWDGYK